MIASRLLLSTLIVPLLALPSDAQRMTPVAPVATRALDSMSPAPGSSTRPSGALLRDTEPEPGREPSVAGTVIGGIVGGALGTFVGGMVGASARTGCQGDMCGLESAAMGILIGEPLGLAIGAHLGSRSTRHERVLMTSLTSVGILIGGVAAAVGVGRIDGTGGAILVPLIPVLQLVGTVAIETH